MKSLSWISLHFAIWSFFHWEKWNDWLGSCSSESESALSLLLLSSKLASLFKVRCFLVGGVSVWASKKALSLSGSDLTGKSFSLWSSWMSLGSLKWEIPLMFNSVELQSSFSWLSMSCSSVMNMSVLPPVLARGKKCGDISGYKIIKISCFYTESKLNSYLLTRSNQPLKRTWVWASLNTGI